MSRSELKKAAAVLSVSMITILGSTAVSPALSGIKEAFPQYSDSMIQLVLTLPPLFIIPSCFLCGYAVRKAGQKRVLILGILIYLLGGLGAALMPGFYSMLAMRAVLGMGCGFITPMAQNLISANFTGKIRERLTGYSASASYLMGIAASFTVGRLAEIHWRLAFLIYFVALVVLILNVLYLPDNKKEDAAAPSEKKKISGAAWFTIFCMFLINAAFYTFTSSISLFMQQEGLGGQAVSGNVVAVFMACGFFMGLAASGIRRALKQFYMAFGCLLMGLGYFGLGLARELPLVFVCAALVGASYSVFYAGIFLRIGQLSATKEENVRLVTITTAGMFAGQTLSVSLLHGAELLCGMEGYRFRFEFLAGCLAAAGLAVVAAGIRNRLYGKRNESRRIEER